MTNFHVYAGAEGAPAYPDVRSIEVGDLYDCLRAGYEDIMAKPSHIIYIIEMYPLIVVVIWMGVYPSSFLSVTEASVNQLIETYQTKLAQGAGAAAVAAR